MAKGSKDVAKNEGTRAVAQQGERNVYQQFGDEVRQTGIEGDLIRFNKQGEWIAGQEEEEIEIGTPVIMGLNTLKRGWVKWDDNKPVDSRMGLLSEGFRPANREDLGDTDDEQWPLDENDKPRDPWQETTQVLLLSEEGRVFTFATSSKSGKTALGEVSTAYGNRLQDGGDPDEMPVVLLQKSFYKHKQYGKVMIPVFEMTDEWRSPPERQAEPEKDKKGGKKAAPAKGGKPSGAANRPAPKALPAPRKPANGRSGARI